MAVKEPKQPKSTGARREPEYVDKPSPFSIEGIRSGAVQSRVVKALIVVSGLALAGGFIMSSLQPTGLPQNSGASARLGSTVATVGGQTISGAQFERAWANDQQMKQQYIQYGLAQPTTVASYLSDKQTTLKRLTDQAALVDAAQKAGLVVSDAEVDAEIDKQLRQAFVPQPGQTPAQFLRLVQTRFNVQTLDEAIAKQKADITPDAREQIRQKLLVDKLKKQTVDATVATDDDYKRSVTKLDLYQILIRPELPKGTVKDFKAESDRLAKDAQTKASALVADLRKNPTRANFKAVAQKQSGDVATRAKGGALGPKLPSQLPPDIGDALAKSAQNIVGPLPYTGDMPGTQVIYFIGARKTDLPKDYEKKKTKLLADFKTQQGEAAWSKKQEALQKAVTPDVSDPALMAYSLQSDLFTKSPTEQPKVREEVLTHYDEALKSGVGGEEAAAINFQKASLLRDMNRPAESLAALKAAASGAKNDASVQLQLAQALRDAKQNEAAVEAFKAASQALDQNPTPSSPYGAGGGDAGLRQQIAFGFDALKQPQLAAAERAKIKPAKPAASPFGGLPGGISIKPAGK